MAWAPLTMMLSTAWLSAPMWQSTGGSSPSSVRTSATYLYSLRAIVSVVAIARLRSAWLRSARSGWANSLSERTMVATRSRPSTERATALGISSSR